jgi:hypothetical protein
MSYSNSELGAYDPNQWHADSEANTKASEAIHKKMKAGKRLTDSEMKTWWTALKAYQAGGATARPLAQKGQAQVDQCRANAPKGGKSRGNYTDAQIQQAFAQYKQRNPGKTAWDAAQALIREGQPLDGFKTVTGPWNRIARMAGSQWGVTRDDWFSGL